MRYRPEIDGLRAFAVLPVILFHTGFGLVPGGFVGVDVFFVLSGYLITGILIEDLAGDRFSLWSFYERRARRILPALFVMILCCVPLAWFLLAPPDLQDFFQSVAASALFSANFLFWRESGYFDTSGQIKPLLHLWSLAVEEQFYLVFPLALAGLWRLGQRASAWLFILAALGSLAVAQVSLDRHPSASYFLLPSRAWELLLGALCAFGLRSVPRPLSQSVAGLLGLGGLAMIVVPVLAYDRNTPFPGLTALAPCLGTALMVVFGREGTLAGRLLSSRGLVAVGLLSYSAYLWHHPLLVFRRYSVFEMTLADRLGVIALTFLLAWLSWRLVERPFRDRAFLSRRQILGSAVVALAALLVVAGIGAAGRGYPDRRLLAGEATQTWPEVWNRRLQAESWQDLRTLSGEPDYGTENNPFDRQPWFDPTDPRQKLLIVGNSHSKDLWNVLRASRSTVARFQIARFGIQIADIPGNPDFLTSPNFVQADVVILASRYRTTDVPELQAIAAEVLSRGKRLVIVARLLEIPEFRGGLATLADRVIAGARTEGMRDPAEIALRSDRAYFDAYAQDRAGRAHPAVAAIAQLRRDNPDILVLDRIDYVCGRTTGGCDSVSADLTRYFYDYAHHTRAGALHFGKRVDETGWLKIP